VTGLAIKGNSIFSNGGLGIDLSLDGVTLNDPGDPDTGPNNLQNYPVINGVTISGGSATILNSTASPTLELHDGSGATIATNDNWKDTQHAEIEASGIAPTDDRESAIQTQAPGNHTAIVRGKNNTTGVGLVEVYNLP
jgi:hypothetical protein